MFSSRKLVVLAAVIALASVMLTAAPAAARPDGNGTVCVVADLAGFDDASFNADVLAGAERAVKRLRVDLETAEPESPADISAAIDAWVTSGDCDLIIGVGFFVGDLMEPFLLADPNQRFAVIDSVFQNSGNAASVTFRQDQPSFMAGYVAAAASTTGKVGTYGGSPFPSVTDFMNGYALGVDYFNSQTGSAVETLGWDVDTQSGLFSFTFDDPVIGYSMAQDLFDQGADTVFPVSGRTSLGSFEAAVDRKNAGDDVRVVWADIDFFELSGRDRAKVLLTSAIKNFDVATYSQIEALVDGSWTSGPVVEDLADGGVELAPFHRTNNQVPGFVRPALRDIRAGILDASIPTLP